MIVEVLPFNELLLEIDIILVGEQLVELVPVGLVGSFHLAIELRGPRFDVDVPDSLVGDVPVEPRLELVPSIGSDRVNPKWELLDHAIDEINRVLLIVTIVDFEGSNPGGVRDLLDNLRGELTWMALRDRFLSDQLVDAPQPWRFILETLFYRLVCTRRSQPVKACARLARLRMRDSNEDSHLHIRRVFLALQAQISAKIDLIGILGRAVHP